MSQYSDMQKEKLEKRTELINKIMFIPIVLLLAVIPLIVRLIYVQPKDGRMNILFGKVKLDDYYSQYKATGIILLTIVMVILFYLFIEKSQMKIDKFSKVYFISAGVLVGMTILSTILSEYKEIAVWGVYDRAEGLVMWCCYIFIMFYTFYVVRNEKSYIWIIAPLMFLVVVTAIIGFFQYIGHDPLTSTKLGLSLVIPPELRGDVSGLTSDYESHKVLGTLYHYNYVGSFGAMMVPLFVTLTLLVRGRVKKIALGIVSIAALFVLFGSTARSGLVGLGLAVVVGIIVFGRKILSAWKKVLPLVIVLVLVVVGFDVATGGSIFSRIPTLLEDGLALFKQTDTEFNYKDHIPVREVINENGKVTFVLQEEELTIEYVDDDIQMTDKEGNVIEYTSEIDYGMVTNSGVNPETKYTTTDARFANISMIIQDIGVFTSQDPIHGLLVQIDGNGQGFFSFKLDENGVTEIDSFSGLPLEEIEAESIGFKGKEKLGSARGYIWSRSLPVFLKNNLLVGNGPDTFIAYFPQNDRLAKWWAYDMTNSLVDKAHSLYLQIGMNQGGIALVAFLVMMIVYIVHSFKLYAFKTYYDGSDAMGIGIMLAIIGYLGAGIFNDSLVSVAPIFWILLGAGFAVNYIKQQAQDKLEKQAPHRVIKMK